MMELPDEIVLRIINEIDEGDIAAIARINKYFENLSNDRQIWINKIPDYFYKPTGWTWKNFYKMLELYGEANASKYIIACIDSREKEEFEFLPDGHYFYYKGYNRKPYITGNLYQEETTLFGLKQEQLIDSLEWEIDHFRYSLYSPYLKRLILNKLHRFNDRNKRLTSQLSDYYLLIEI